MDTFFEYLTLGLWVFPFYFFLISALLFHKKINPSRFFGYSSKGQLIMGIAFLFCASSFLFQGSAVYLALMLVYCVILIWATRVEKKAKQNWQAYNS